MSGLLKPKTYKIEDSNIANFGTKLEKDVKAAAAAKEPQWDNAGKEVGLLIWRIEKFHVKPVPKETYGSFYSGDSYIILQTYKTAQGEMKWKIFFWLGDHTTQDEAGTAAYKTVELDDRLGGKAPQSRETQGAESKEFVALFPTGIKTMEGGIDSGFRHVSAVEYKPRLLQIRPIGNHHVAAAQVPFAASSFNEDDCYIVDMGLKVYQVAGAKAVGTEKSKAMQMAHAIKDERDGKPEIIVCTMSDDQLPWKELGGKPGKFPAAPADPAPAPKKLLKVNNKSPFAVNEVVTKTITRAHLDDGDTFIIDNHTEVYVWVGDETPKEEKRAALQIAADYVKHSGKPAGTAIKRVIENAEPDVFLALFD